VSNENDQANRAISTGKLHALLHFHTRPINVVVFHGSQGNTRFEVGFPLRCFQRLSRPYIATLLCRLAPQQVHQRYVHPGPLVLGTDPLNIPTPTADRDRTVSRRSEPSSRTTLNGEQPYPWDLLQPQDVMSRHRGAKQPRRYGLLGVISLLSPAYLLSVERWPFHAGPPDHYDRLSSLLDLSVSQSGRLMPLHSTTISDRSEPTIARLRYSLGGDRPSQTTHHTLSRTRITGRG
jgi:hypothetical protein